jgi:hypothetical protein
MPPSVCIDHAVESIQHTKEGIMPVIRTFIAKVKPGRMQDAVTQLATLKRLSMEAGATDFTAYNVVTGPIFPGLLSHIVCNDLAAYGAARDTVLAHPESAQFFAADAPIDTVGALLVESVYTAGNPSSIIAQTKVRFTIVLQPKRGRGEDVVRRLSRLADTAHECGALAADVRRAIAGPDGPRMYLHAFHAGYAEWQATRAAVQESDYWQALSRSQDEAAVRKQSIVSAKIDL